VTTMIPVLLLLCAAANEPAAGPPAAGPPTAVPPSPAPTVESRNIEILIAGPEEERRKMETSVRALLGEASDLEWTQKESLPKDEPLPGTHPDGGGEIWIDLANPAQLRVYLPAPDAMGSTSVRTVVRPTRADSEQVLQKTVAQIVKTAVQALRGEDATPAASTIATPVPSDAEPPAPHAVDTAQQPAIPPSLATRLRAFGVVLAAGGHTSPFNLAEPAGDKNWLGPSVVGQVRWHADKYMVALRMSWETSDRSIDQYYLKSTYLAGTAGGFRVVGSDIATFGIGVEMGVLVLHQNTWLDSAYPWGNTYVASMPGQLGKTNSTGMLFGPVAEFNLAPTPRIFLHVEASAPIAMLKMQTYSGTGWTTGGYFRLALGVGFRL